MDFIEFKITNIQNEIIDLTNFIKQQNIKQKLGLSEIKSENKFENKNKLEKEEEKINKNEEEEKNKNKNENLLKKESWADIAEREEFEEKSLKLEKLEKIKFEDLENIKEQIEKFGKSIYTINNHLNLNKKSKYVKFSFINNIITWELRSEHIFDNKIKIILNPLFGNNEIIQVFYYDTSTNKLGVKNTKTNNFDWYTIDFKQRLLIYYDLNFNQKYVYYKFVQPEQSIENK